MRGEYFVTTGIPGDRSGHSNARTAEAGSARTGGSSGNRTRYAFFICYSATRRDGRSGAQGSGSTPGIGGAIR